MNLSPNNVKNLSLFEFVSLMALLMSLAALSIDAMLPALPIIGKELGVKVENHNQMIITFLFLGLSMGQAICGPFADRYGRKPIINIGIVIFIIGCLVSIFAVNFKIMLFGRILQGFGISSTRIVTMAIVRDQYSGNKMAKIMSLITMLFIIVPTVAPSIGQLILFKFHWKAIFFLFILLSLIGVVWFQKRQCETLKKEDQKKIEFDHLKKATIRVFKTKVSIGYTITSGFIFGAFVGYLISSQQIFQNIFGLGTEFTLYFGGLALTIGLSSYINSRMVEKYGMVKLTTIATIILSIISAFYLSYLILTDHQNSLIVFMAYMMLAFSCVGVLFGNFNSLALEPLGDIAGLATSIISTIQNILSIGLGTLIGLYFANNLFPLISGFLIMGILSLGVIYWIHLPQSNK